MWKEILGYLFVGLIIITSLINIFMPFIVGVISFISLLNSLNIKKFNKIKDCLLKPFKDCYIFKLMSLIMVVGFLFHNFIYNLFSMEKTIEEQINVFKNLLSNQTFEFTPYIWATIIFLVFIILCIVSFISLIYKDKIILSCKESSNKIVENNSANIIELELTQIDEETELVQSDDFNTD